MGFNASMDIIRSHGKLSNYLRKQVGLKSSSCNMEEAYLTENYPNNYYAVVKNIGLKRHMICKLTCAISIRFLAPPLDDISHLRVH